MAVIEYLRVVCEHTEGRTRYDDERLDHAMSVAIDTNDQFKHLIWDYQRPSFWETVNSFAPVS